MLKKLKLAGRTVLITGGGGGIGAAVAAKLADRGANIVVTGRSQSRLERATASLPKARLLVVTADVTDAARMRHVIDAAVVRFGHSMTPSARSRSSTSSSPTPA